MCAVQSVGMLPVEHLHLEHVLQTVCVLESVVCRSFGPEGGQVLFTQDTGQAMLSRSGARILTALRLEHPLARMVVECVLKHSTETGDGSKTFIILMASLLRIIHTTACREPHVSRTHTSKAAAETASARHLADKMLAFASEELDDLIAAAVVPYGCCLSWEELSAKSQAHSNNPCVQNLLASFFQSRVGPTHCDLMSNLTCELLTNWKFKNDSPSSSLHFIRDNLAALHTPVSGFPISFSRLVEGQVIHRDFAAPCPRADLQPVKAVVLTGYLQPKLLRAGEVLELGRGEQSEERNIMDFSAWGERSLECVLANLQSLGVSVLLSAVKQSAAVLALATQAEMSIVECVSEDELSLFQRLSGATPVRDCRVIEPEHVATLTFCRPILLGAHRYVHVAFHDTEEKITVKPCSLVLCGLGEGQTDQFACALKDAMRMLLSTWDPIGITAAPFKQCVLEPGCVLPAGGTFELLLNNALLQHGSSCSISDHTNKGVPAVSQLLAKALLSVPRQIYYHSPRRLLQTQTRLLSLTKNHLSIAHNKILTQSHREDGTLTEPCRGEVLMSGSGLESVSCKSQVLLAALQCVSSLLRVDAVLRTHTALHTQSHRRTNISWAGTEDEAED
uniref:Bardet-Biedl syndrome 10 n=1 Tax=Gasterosteus aculeatus aculeatus TaxID=481459 RepID=G3PIC2_GASAC|nr:Bardet-Biedl syndrome 10 protein [Gasterosteus aculeatus aculeatus]